MFDPWTSLQSETSSVLRYANCCSSEVPRSWMKTHAGAIHTLYTIQSLTVRTFPCHLGTLLPTERILFSTPRRLGKRLCTAADAYTGKCLPVWRASCHCMQVDMQSIVLADAPPAWLSLGAPSVQPWPIGFSALHVGFACKSTVMDCVSKEFSKPERPASASVPEFGKADRLSKANVGFH